MYLYMCLSCCVVCVCVRVCSELYVADVMGALFISALVFSTMVPLSSSTAKILLQVCPVLCLTVGRGDRGIG